MTVTITRGVGRRTNLVQGMEPRGVTIRRPPDGNPLFVMPTTDELQRLHASVIARYPRLAPRSQHIDEDFDGFRRAFLRIGHLGRDKLNDKYALLSWVDNAAIWLRDHHIIPTMLTPRDFMCAVLAHGDVEHAPLARYPFDCSAFGLRRDRTGRRATDGWKALLTTGHLREPVRLPR